MPPHTSGVQQTYPVKNEVLINTPLDKCWWEGC